MMVKKLVLVLLLVTTSVGLKAQTVEKVIANYISFTGGEKQWKKIQSIVSSGNYNYGGLEFPFEAFSKAPDHYKYIVSSNGKSFIQSFDGSAGWKIDGFKEETAKTMLTGNEARAMANEADVELETPFINYKQKGYQAILVGREQVNNTDCYKIRLIRDSDTSTYFFNANDYSLIKKQAVSKNAELDKSLLDTYYSDYTMVEGIKAPFKMISKIGDQTILTITVQKMQLNTTIDENIFKP